jgi:hypothetical protein
MESNIRLRLRVNPPLNASGDSLQFRILPHFRSRAADEINQAHGLAGEIALPARDQARKRNAAQFTTATDFVGR